MTLVGRPERPAAAPDDDDPSGSARAASAAPARRSPLRRALRATLLVGAVGAAASAPWWGPAALGRLAYFRVRRVELEGVRYVRPAELLARIGADTTRSVWGDLAPVERRVAAHPMVAAATVERRLPGTLRVRLTERVPVAMALVRDGVVVYDATGAVLPIEPSAVGGLDVPVVAGRDSALLAVLGALRVGAPRLYARVGEARRVRVPAPAGATGRDELAFSLAAPGAAPGAAPAAAPAGPTGAPPGGVPAGSAPPAGPIVVRALPDVTVGRLADLAPVEADLARRRVRVAEIDLRFRDQVIARLQ